MRIEDSMSRILDSSEGEEGGRSTDKEIGVSEMVVLGTGEIGDKAGELMKKREAILKAGFFMPESVVLSTSIVEGFLKDNGLGESLSEVEVSKNTRKKIFKGKFGDGQKKELKKLYTLLPTEVPWIVRSSAVGDAKGTGVYESKFCKAKEGNVEEVIKEVIGRYFTKGAKGFRESLKLKDGLGVLIQPVVGERYGDMFFPDFSGFSNPDIDGGSVVLNMVRGLRAGVDGFHGERITRKKIEKCYDKKMLGDFLRALRGLIIDKEEPWRESSLLGESGSIFGSVLQKTQSGGIKIEEKQALIRVDDYMFADKHIDLLNLIEMVEKLAEICESGQYVEFAINEKGGKVEVSVLQISDSEELEGEVNFDQPGEILFETESVRGTKEIFVDNLLYIREELDLGVALDKVRGKTLLFLDGAWAGSRSTKANKFDGWLSKVNFSDDRIAGVVWIQWAICLKDFGLQVNHLWWYETPGGR